MTKRVLFMFTLLICLTTGMVYAEDVPVQKEAVTDVVQKNGSIKILSVKRAKNYKHSASVKIKVTNAYGRCAQIQVKDPYLKKWRTEKTVKLGNSGTVTSTLKLPNSWKVYSSSSWRIRLPERILDKGSTETDTQVVHHIWNLKSANSSTFKLKNKVVSKVRAALVMDGKTGKIIYAYNARKHLKVASLTKMLTMIVAAEESKAGDVVTIPPAAAAAQKASGGPGLTVGDKIRMKDLWYEALLPSSNAAAVAIACDISGSQGKFVEKMRKRAKQLGATESTWKNAYGDWHTNTHSTAYDQALIARKLMTGSRYKTMRSIMKTRRHAYTSLGYHNRYVAEMGSARALILHGPSIGVKIGENPKAKWCYTNAWKVKGKLYISVVLGSTSNKGLWSNHRKLMKFSNYFVRKNGREVNIKA